jgi:hypothetical protein
VNDEAKRAAPFTRKTGAFGAKIYFRPQVFHRICTPRRHLFHSLKVSLEWRVAMGSGTGSAKED